MTKQDKLKYNREWREKNKDRLNRRRRDLYAANPNAQAKSRARTKLYRERHPDREREKKHAMRKKCVEYLGGRCLHCGLVDDPISYDFHHKDPTQKDFTISGKALKYSWDRIVVELGKCQLLCCICHRKLHQALGL